MALPSPPIAYYPLGTSAYNGEYLAENNAIGDYVFDFIPNDYIDIGNQDGLKNITELSISLWFNYDSIATSADGLVARDSSSRVDGNWYVSLDFNNSIRFLLKTANGQDALNSSTISPNKWYHTLCVWNGQNMKIYLNGSLDNSITLSNATGTLGSTSDIVAIGRRFASGGFLNGKASNVQIWNKELIASEVETLYNYGSPIRNLANIPQSSNLKAWYKLDASEVYNSTTTEWSIDNNQNPSAYPSSLNFNGSSNYIDCGTGSRFYINQITISAWVNLSSGLTSTQIIAGIRNNTLGGGSICYQLQNQASGKFRFVIRQSNGTYVDSVANDVHQYNTWYHVLGVADGSNIKLYVNGNLQTIVSSYDGTIYSPNENFNIGRQSSPSNYYFDGKLSNVSVFNTGLTSAQVTELYNNGTPSNLLNHSVTSNLVSWWKLNNTTTGIEDAKGSNNGTNNGATEYTGFVNKLVGDSSGMSQANLVQSDLQTVAPYSKYAMDFNGTDDYISIASAGGIALMNTGVSSTVSLWVYPTGTGTRVFFEQNSTGRYVIYQSGTSLFFYPNSARASFTNLILNQWYNVIAIVDGSNSKFYVNGNEVGTSTSYTPVNTLGVLQFGRYPGGTQYFEGKLSNVSIWNTDLTSAQVSEIYNQGLPGNLNSHSAYSNLVSWWQLGENSSFDGNDWIVADEKGTNNGTSIDMPVGALTNGVGTTANGVSSGMSEGNLVGDAPYSTANAISTNMVVTSRVTGSGNTP